MPIFSLHAISVNSQYDRLSARPPPRFLEPRYLKKQSTMYIDETRVKLITLISFLAIRFHATTDILGTYSRSIDYFSVHRILTCGLAGGFPV